MYPPIVEVVMQEQLKIPELSTQYSPEDVLLCHSQWSNCGQLAAGYSNCIVRIKVAGMARRNTGRGRVVRVPNVMQITLATRVL